MGRTCRICGMSRANEQFGGRGLRAVVCRRCWQLPKADLQRILATDEVYGFLDQSRISAKNIQSLRELEAIDRVTFQSLRTIVFEIATVVPRKRKRWTILPDKHPDLFQRIINSDWFDHVLDEMCISRFYP